MPNKRRLAHRTPISNAVDNNLLAQFNLLHQRTRIPKSKLLDEAIELLLEKHGMTKPIRSDD
jgi:hypothetical protein